jgi:copper chaperone CopZ
MRGRSIENRGVGVEISSCPGFHEARFISGTPPASIANGADEGCQPGPDKAQRDRSSHILRGFNPSAVTTMRGVRQENGRREIGSVGLQTVRILFQQKRNYQKERAMITEQITIEGMTCGGCVASVTRVLERLPIANKSVSIGAAEVTYDETIVTREQIADAIEGAGFEVVHRKPVGE